MSPMTSIQKWFPDYRAFASGLAVCGFGAGTIVFSKILVPLMSHIGLAMTFVAIGGSFFVLIGSQCFVFRYPPPGYKEVKPVIYEKIVDYGTMSIDSDKETPGDPREMTIRRALSGAEFHLIYVAYLCNSICSLVVVSRLSDLVQNIYKMDSDVASTIVTIKGCFSIFGIIVWSLLADRLGRKATLVMSFTGQIVIVALLPYMTSHHHFYWFIGLIWSVTLFEGAGSVFPALLTELYGHKCFSGLYGILLTAMVISGVGGGILFTFIYDFLVSRGHSISDPFIYNINFYWILGVLVLGWLSLWFIKMPVKDTTKDRQWLSIKVSDTTIRLGSTSGFQMSQSDSMEWKDFITPLIVTNSKDQYIL
eukprot:gene12506-14679_t